MACTPFDVCYGAFVTLLRADGSVDPTFGNAGFVLLPNSVLPMVVPIPPSSLKPVRRVA